MEWLSCIREAIGFMEDRLTDIRSPEEVARHVHVSCMYLQKGFQILTGYTLGEYMRNRRLYLAALELKSGRDSVLGIALRYGYENQAGFDKAFSRFHGATPREVRCGAPIRTFLPVTVQISISGGDSMKFRIENKESIRTVGFSRVFSCEDSYTEIPKFWDEMTAKYAPHLMRGEKPEGAAETYVADHHIGEFGICSDIAGSNTFGYTIAGYDRGDGIPEGMTAGEIPAGTWAVFDCTLRTLQETNTRIWKEWIPGNPGYEARGGVCVEWYAPDCAPGPDQRCEIRIPVRAKKA